MASTGKCEYCGATVRSDQESCPKCGAPNPNFIPESERRIFLPKTIEELKEYCAERGMPLLRMRFFIGEDFKEPKAFGIYQDGNQFVVYKNKANGSRAIRYQRLDEAYAVSEIFAKLLEECHNRGIYPDGKPSSDSGRVRGSAPSDSAEKQKRKKRLFTIAVLVFLALQVFMFWDMRRAHRNDGYYRYNGNTYYNYGETWYYDTGSSWIETDSEPVSNYEDYYAGSDYESDWGGSDFKNSAAWDRIQESHSSSSSDYDSWDSDDTDWDSDW